jgi:sulfur carrier protein
MQKVTSGVTKNTPFLILNGKKVPVYSPLTVEELLEQEKIPPQGIAVVVNGTIVPRGKWKETHLQGGEEVEVVGMMGGG